MGAAIGAVVDWQLDDCEDGEEVNEVDPPAGVWDRTLDYDFRRISP